MCSSQLVAWFPFNSFSLFDTLYPQKRSAMLRKIFQFNYGYSLSRMSRYISYKNVDPNVVDELKQKIEDEKEFEEVNEDALQKLFNSDTDKEKVSKIINIYETMKYDLENVPSTIKRADIIRMIQFSVADVRRYIKKLHNKELNNLLKKELKKLQPVEVTATSDIRSGIFDANNNLTYGLWHNTLFTRISKGHMRSALDKHRFSELFGQNLCLDLSFSSQLNYHLSAQVGSDIASMLNFNYYQLDEPFKITLCGVNEEDHLWQFLRNHFAPLLSFCTHTNQSFIELFPDKTKLVYFTSLETKNHLEYEPDCHYVMAGLSEKNMQHDFLKSHLRKLKVTRQGIPIDQHVVWHMGYKRFSLLVKLKMLSDKRNGKHWKNIILDNIDSSRFKTVDQVLDEDKRRKQKYQKKKVQR